MEKHSESRLSYLFAHLHLLSSDLFSSELSRLSDSSLLCFSSVHIVGSLASKLPSNICDVHADVIRMCMCVCVRREVILFSCDLRLGGSNVNVCKRKYTHLVACDVKL